MSKIITGSCACGEIEFEVRAIKSNVVNCHCNTCRKLNGSSFSTYFVVAEKCFKITSGEKALTSYFPSDSVVKNFCQKCGSPLFNQNKKYPNLRMIYLGSLNCNEPVTPNVNIFCQSQLPWVLVNAEIPNFEKEIEQ